MPVAGRIPRQVLPSMPGFALCRRLRACLPKFSRCTGYCRYRPSMTGDSGKGSPQGADFRCCLRGDQLRTAELCQQQGIKFFPFGQRLPGPGSSWSTSLSDGRSGGDACAQPPRAAPLRRDPAGAERYYPRLPCARQPAQTSRIGGNAGAYRSLPSSCHAVAAINCIQRDAGVDPDYHPELKFNVPMVAIPPGMDQYQFPYFDLIPCSRPIWWHCPTLSTLLAPIDASY